VKKPIKISCLPVAGIQNPYQFLMMKGLEADPRLIVKNGIDDRFFGILRTAVLQKPDYIHFDWETSYYYRRSLWMTLLNVPFFMFQVCIVRFIFNCKIVWTPHNIIPHDSKYLKIHRVCRRFLAKNTKWIRLFSRISLPAAVAELKCKESKFKIIPEGSYVDYYPNKISRSEAKFFLNIPEDIMVLLYMGFIKPYKGIDNLIDCFKKSFDARATLVIAGKVMDPDYFETIKKSLNEQIVLFDRFIENGELQYFFNAADVVALPFKKIENSGSVILAMSFKKAVIAPAMGVLKERLANQEKLLYAESLEESFEILKNMTVAELIETGEKNSRELHKFNWTDFAKAF
jgi:glycosyltransferase involved in cell wall biosynthesis